ncbi:MAG: hypothetical protein R6U99_06010 [Nioella sp.]
MTKPPIDDPKLPLADLITAWPETIPVFVRHRMLCVGCFVSSIHTVTDACIAYELDKDLFLRELMRAAGMA